MLNLVKYYQDDPDLDEPPALEAVTSPGSHHGLTAGSGLDGFPSGSASCIGAGDDMNGGTLKRSSRGESPGAASLRKYAIQNSNTSAVAIGK